MPREYRAKHALSEMDVDGRAGVCAACGPVRIFKHPHTACGYVCGRRPPTDRMRAPKRHVLSRVDVGKRVAVCAHCGPVDVRVTGDGRVVCAPGQREAVRRSSIRRYYGLSLDEWDAMWRAQCGRCAICTDALEEWGTGGVNVDHDHATGAVRGLLCRGCNTGLGQFRDNAVALRAAAAYVERGGA